MTCQLAEVPTAERAAIIRRYLEKVPGGRPHIPVSLGAPLTDFEALAPRYPVFRVIPVDGQLPGPRRGARSTRTPVVAPATDGVQ